MSNLPKGNTWDSNLNPWTNDKKFVEFPTDLVDKFQGSKWSEYHTSEHAEEVIQKFKDFNKHLWYEVGNMMIEGNMYINNLPTWFQSIFKNADVDAQKKIFDHVKVFHNHIQFKIQKDGQEVIVPISRTNLLLDKVIPGSLETHNGMSYGKLSDNHFPIWQEIGLVELQEMAKLMPAGDYNPAKNNSTAAYQLSILLDAPVAWYSTWAGAVYDDDIKLEPIKDHITESDGSSYLYTWAKDDQGRYIKLWRHSDPDLEMGSIDFHDPSKLLPMRTRMQIMNLSHSIDNDTVLKKKIEEWFGYSATNHGASVASTPIAQINNSPIVVPASDWLGSKADFETIQGEVNFKTGMWNAPRVDIKNIGE